MSRACSSVPTDVTTTRTDGGAFAGLFIPNKVREAFRAVKRGRKMVEAGGVEPPSEAPERRDSPRSVRTCFFSRRVFRSGRPGAAANLKLSGRLFRWRRRPQPGFRVKRRGAPDRLPGARHG